MVVTPGPVIDFLVTNQNVRDIRDIDWPRVCGITYSLKCYIICFLESRAENIFINLYL